MTMQVPDPWPTQSPERPRRKRSLLLWVCVGGFAAGPSSGALVAVLILLLVPSVHGSHGGSMAGGGAGLLIPIGAIIGIPVGALAGFLLGKAVGAGRPTLPTLK
jgi:hypothetical protein